MARRASLVDISGRRRRWRRSLFWGGILLVLGLLIAGCLWLVLYSEAIKVREVRVTGANYISEEEVRAFAVAHAAEGWLSRLLGSENMLAWPDGFSKEALRELPAAKGASVDKSYFRRAVTVNVSERERAGLWCFETASPRECFWFDTSGLLFMPGYAVEGNLTAVLHDYSRPPLGLGQTALEDRLLQNLLSVFAALRRMDLSVREVRLNDLALQEVAVLTYDGPRLLFSLRFPAAAAPEAVAALERMIPLANLEYIDFRVESKVYYK